MNDFFFLLTMSAITLLSLITSWLSTHRLKKQLTQTQWSSFFFLVTLQIFIPLLGTALVFMLNVYLKNHLKKVYPIPIETFKKLIYTRKNPVKTDPYGDGWAAIRLQFSNFSELERKQALISLNKGIKREANQMYNHLVSDDMEELRICAFSLLENQQNLLHDNINQLLQISQRLTSTPTNNTTLKKSAFYDKQLARLYWELVYLNLGDSDFRKIMLNKSKTYTEKALLVDQDDPSLWILLARIAIEDGQWEKGANLLLHAEKCQGSLNKIYPYLAEHSYLKQEYQQVKTYLSKDVSFRDIPRINKTVSFWCTQ
jgi:hypothetical protein